MILDEQHLFLKLFMQVEHLHFVNVLFSKMPPACLDHGDLLPMQFKRVVDLEWLKGPSTAAIWWQTKISSTTHALVRNMYTKSFFHFCQTMHNSCALYDKPYLLCVNKMILSKTYLIMESNY